VRQTFAAHGDADRGALEAAFAQGHPEQGAEQTASDRCLVALVFRADPTRRQRPHEAL
jgi:hypothetical protein